MMASPMVGQRLGACSTPEIHGRLQSAHFATWTRKAPVTGSRTDRLGSPFVGRRRKVYVITALTITGGLNAILGWMQSDSRRAAWDSAVQSSRNLVAALEHDIARNIEVYDL